MAGVQAILTRLLKGGLKNKKLRKEAEEPVRKMLDDIPSKKFLTAEQEASHQKYLEEYANRPAEVPNVDEVESAAKEVNAPKVKEEAAPEDDLTPEAVQMYRKKYNITPGDARKRQGPKPSAIQKQPVTPEIVERARKQLPEFSDATDEDVVNLYRDLGYE